MANGFHGRLGLFRRPHFARTLLLLMAVVFLVVFVAEVSLYVGLRRLYERTVVDFQFRLIEQSQDTTETFLRMAERHALATAALPGLNALLNREFRLDEGYDQFLRMQSALSAVLGGFGAESIHSVYAYGSAQEVVFTADGFAHADRFAGAEFIDQFRRTPEFFRWYPSHRFGSTNARVISYVVPVPLPDTGRGSFLVVNIDANYLAGIVTRSGGADHFELFVLTGDGRPVFVGNEEMLNDLSQSDALPRLIQSGEDGHSFVEIDGVAYYAAVRSLGTPGWRYLTLGRRDRLLLGTERFARVALIVAGLCVAVAGLVVATFARVFYRPVEKLSNQVQRAFDSLGLDLPDDGSERNELRRIAWEFSVLVEANQEHARRMLRDREALQESLLRDVLNRRYASLAEIRGRASELAFPLDERNLGLLLIASHPYREAPADRYARRETIEDVVHDQTAAGCRFFVLSEADYYTLVIDLSAAATRRRTDDLLERLALALLPSDAEEQLLIIGGVADSFRELSLRYRSAVRLYGLRRAVVQRRILRVGDGTLLDDAGRAAAEFEQAIAGYRHALEVLDLEGAAAAGRAILDSLGSSSDLVYRQAKINEVGNALILSVLANTNAGEIFPPVSSPWASYQQLGSVGAVKAWFLATIDAFDHVLQARRQAGQTRLVHKVRAEIEARYTEQITVQELADGQQITQSYLSSLFHEETGMTVSHCIAEKRLEHACRLLRETDLLVKRIAAESGYGQKQNMIRAFKRRLGVTPGEYRRQYHSAKT